MDNLRGYLGAADYGAGEHDYGLGDDDVGNEPPPSPVGQDERRMQVRAYNHWASLLADSNFPSIEDLEPSELPDFGPYSVLLDFTNGIDDPSVRFIGDMLAGECDVSGAIDQLSDVPSRSLLTRITDHYMQILANQAPIGFEAEFVNQRGETILYRGILLPFSSDDDTIDFIYGVINWKQMADQMTSDELLLEIDQALEVDNDRSHRADPVTDWADGPGAESVAPVEAVSPLVTKVANNDPFPLPAFGNDDGGGYEPEAEDGDEDDGDEAGLYEAIEAVDDEPEGPSRFASLLGLGGGRPTSEGFDEDEEEDYGDEDEDPVAKWLARPTPLGALPDVDFGGADADDEPVESADESFDAPAAVEPVAEHVDETDVVGSPLELVDAADDDTDEYGADEPLELVDMVDGSGVQADRSEDVLSERPTPPEPVLSGSAPVEPAKIASGDGGLYDCLAEARELALAARSSEDRSRTALYAAVGRAYDFSLAAQAEPEDFAELMADSGLTMQDRAPMTPVVKLVFGADYDKTRLTEYAAVLTHAHRMGIERGSLAGYLGAAEGGLKGVVQSERALRRADDGEAAVRETPREALARKLRSIAPLGFEDIDTEGEEFALVMIRRVDGKVVVLGEITDVPLVEKAAKKLVA